MSLRGHAAFTILASAGLAAARLLAISRFDVNTAATILQVSGTGVSVAGTALTLCCRSRWCCWSARSRWSSSSIPAWST